MILTIFFVLIFIVSIPSSSCNTASLIDPSSCSQTVPTANPLEFLFTPCTIGSVTSISPKQGITGTSIIITGTGFSTILCENHVIIGSSYDCPITNASTTEIVCEIASNSLLNPISIQDIGVVRDLQGYLSNNGLIQFQFQASISSISPTKREFCFFFFIVFLSKFIIHSLGSIYGGTEITISGDGFIAGDTRIIVGSIDYTSMSTVTYSEIKFISQTPPSVYIEQSILITILIGTNVAACSLETCSLTWTESLTPYLDSVNPTSITGPELLTLTGRNLNATRSILTTNTHITINGQTCNVTAVSNSTITREIDSIQAGDHTIFAYIDGNYIKIFRER